MKQRTAPEKTPGAVLTCRVSQDRSGRGRSVDDQEFELREDAADEGVEVRTVLREVNVSASEYGAQDRRQWLAEATDLIHRSDVDRLLAWEVSRIARDPAISEPLIRALRREGVRLGYGGRLYNLNDPDDLHKVRQDINDAALEAGKTSKRVKRHVRRAAAKGRPSGGRRLYGYRRVYSPENGELLGQKPEPAEALVVARVFAAYAAGDSPAAIAADLNRDEVPMPAVAHGGREARAEWYDMRVRKMLGNPGYVGLRVHQGRVIGEATWSGIVDQETWDQVQARLTQGAGQPTHSRTAKHLLSGIVRCGLCRAPMYRQMDPAGYPVVKCLAGGGHLVRAYEPLEAMVTTILVNKLEAEDVEVAAAPDDPETVAARALVAALRQELDDARATFDPSVPGAMASFLFAEAQMNTAIAEAQARVRPSRQVPQVVLDLMGPGAGERWDDLPTDLRRDALAAVLSITVLAGTPGRRGFDRETVKVEPIL